MLIADSTVFCPEVLTSMRQLSNLVLMHRSTHGKSMCRWMLDVGCWGQLTLGPYFFLFLSGL